MPQRKENSDIDKLLSGRDDKGRFIKQTAQIEKMRAVIEKFSNEQSKIQKQLDKSAKAATTALKKENALLKGKNKLQNVISKSQKDQMKVIAKAAKLREKQLKRETRLVQKNFKQQLRLETRLNRTRERLARKTRGSGRGGGFSLPQLGIGLAGLGLGFAVTRQLQEIANSRRSLAISGGLASLQNVKQFIGKDIAVVSGAKLVDQFLQQSPTTLALGRDPLISKGLLRLQEQLSGVGTDLANQIILGLSASFREPKRLKGFLGAISSGENIEQTLRNFQSQNNITETIRALNALQISQSKSTGDPIIDAQRELSKVVEKLKAEFELLSSTVASDLIPILRDLIPELKRLLGFLGGLSTKELIGAGIGVGALAIAGPAIARGGLKIAGRALIPSALGVSKAGIAGAATVAAPIVAGGAIAIHQTNKTKQSLQEALSATERQSLGLRRLDELALKLESEGKPKRAKRVRIERQIANISPAKTESSFLFGPQLTGEFTKNQNRQLAKLNKQRSAVQKDINNLQTRATTENKVISENREQTKALENSSKAVDNFADKLKKTPTPQSKIDTDLSLILKRAELQFGAVEQQSISALKRIELESAKVNIFGVLAAQNEAESFIKQLRIQEKVLNEILSTLDVSTVQGRIEANQLLLQIKSLRLEEKQLRRSMVTAFLDQTLQQASNAGIFNKLIVTADKNLFRGLQKGMIGKNVPRELVGSIDKNLPRRKPQTAQQLFGKNPFKIIDLLPKKVNKSKKVNKPRIGANAADSLENIGKAILKTSKQLRTENQDIDNRLSEKVIDNKKLRSGSLPMTP